MKAYTMLELIVVMVITTIVLAFAVPNYGDLRMRYDAAVSMARLKRAISFAKSQAIYRQQQVVLAPQHSWSDGYTVSSNHIILQTFAGVSAGSQLQWQGFPATSSIRFTAQGFTDFQNGSFYYISREGIVIKRLIVSQSGRVREGD